MTNLKQQGKQEMDGWTAAISATVLGLMIGHWRTVAYFLGFIFEPASDVSGLGFEYILGLLFALALGYIFPRYYLRSSLLLIAAPVIVSHLIHFALQKRVPNLWVPEVLLIVLLTVPYILMAWWGAKIRRQEDRSQIASQEGEQRVAEDPKQNG